MPDQSLLIDAAIILAASFPILFLAKAIRLPQIVGYLLTGVLIGPHALALIAETAQVEAIAELGVALILFFIGMHVPLERIRSFGSTPIVSGLAQMLFTTAVTALALVPLGIEFQTAAFYGLLISLGSTAVVLPILSTRDEIGAPYARRFLGVSLFQDFAVIPLMLMVPAFAPASSAPPLSLIAWKVLIALLGIALLVILTKTVIPPLFRQINRLGSREGFTAGALVLIIATIALAERAGISAALGAFAAGVVVGDTEYSHEISAALRPFRDFLSSLFFASVGMLLDPTFVMRNLGLVILTVAAVVLIKIFAAYPAFRLSKAQPRSSLRAAFAIAPVGEFSFLLAQAAKEFDILSRDHEQLFLSVAVITLGGASGLISLGKRLAARVHDRTERIEQSQDLHALAGHIIIVGFGLNGQNVAKVLSQTAIPYVVVEEDPDRVAAARKIGGRVIIADGADPDALIAAGAEHATGIVIAISDPDGTRQILKTCRRISETLRIIVRTRYVAEVETLRALGANEVIPEEFETSIEIVMRVLQMFHVPGNVVAAQLRLLRDEGYKLLRDPEIKTFEARRLAAIVAAGTYETFLILPESVAEGKRLGELQLDKDRVSVPVLIRDGKTKTPGPDELLAVGDTLLLVGAHADLLRATSRIE